MAVFQKFILSDLKTHPQYKRICIPGPPLVSILFRMVFARLKIDEPKKLNNIIKSAFDFTNN